MNTDLTTGFHNKRLNKYKKNIDTKITVFNRLNQNQLNYSPIFNSGMHIPGRINFHQLLSKPLQNQIHRQNSIKQNQTFSLKFQSENHNNRELDKINKRKQNFNRLIDNKKNSNNLNQNDAVQKMERLSIGQKDSQPLKQASKTMYFKPIGKISQSKYRQSSHTQRKSMQILRNRNLNSKQKQFHHSNNKNNSAHNSFKDKLLMLLQIRKQETNQKRHKNKNNLKRFQNHSKYIDQSNRFSRQRNNRQTMYYQNKYYCDQKHQRAQSSLSLSEYRKKNHSKGQFNKTARLKRFYQQHGNLSMLTPWNLVENVEEF